MEKHLCEIKRKLFYKAIPYLIRNCKVGYDYFILNKYFAPREFPFTWKVFKSFFNIETIIGKEECSVMSECNRYKYEEYINSIASNEGLLYAIWLLMSVCTEGAWNELPDTLAEMVPSYINGPYDSYEEAVAFFENCYPGRLKQLQGKYPKQTIIDLYKELHGEAVSEYAASGYPQAIEDFYKHKTRKDTLELFKYVIKKIQAEEDNPSEQTTITIKYGKGKKVVLDNIDNWFEKVVLGNHFVKYLKDIKSLEDAEAALIMEKYKGRKAAIPRLNHFIFGTYKMLCEHFQTEKVTEQFCVLMRSLLIEMDTPVNLYDGRDVETDIRKLISKMKKNPEKYYLNLSMKKYTMEELKDASAHQTRLYARMTPPAKISLLNPEI